MSMLYKRGRHIKKGRPRDMIKPTLDKGFLFIEKKQKKAVGRNKQKCAHV